LTASKLYFAGIRAGGYDYDYSLPAKLEEILFRLNLAQYIEPKEQVAIKTHFGSYGAFRVVRPVFLRKVVEAVKQAGGRPFVTDTYRIPGPEYLEVANANGINHLSVGAPVIMADGLFGKDQIKVQSGSILGEIGIASAIYYAPAMIVVTHCKGHKASGYAGAIKNLGMGAVASRDHESKPQRGRMHSLDDVKLSWNQENCDQCEQCIDVCPNENLHFDDIKLIIDWDKCERCGRCARVCPNEALVLPQDDDKFQRSLAESARAALSTFKAGKVIYLNFITDVQPECDCMPMSDLPLVPDIGILAGDDLVAVEQATLDLINRSEIIKASKAGEVSRRPQEDLFWSVNGKNPAIQIRAAEELGLGSRDYELISVAKKAAAAEKAGS